MKKSFVLFITLFVLGVGMTCIAQASVLNEKDQVNFTETIHYGDKSLAEGITVEMKSQWDDKLFWDSTYVIGEEPSVTTEYTFHPWSLENRGYYYEGEIQFDVYNAIGDNDWTVEGYKAEGINLAMQELANQTAPGEKKENMIYLKNYMDYYPIVVYVNTEKTVEENGEAVGTYYEWDESQLVFDIEYNEQHGASKEVIEEKKEALEKLKCFKEFFKIPVIDNDIARLAVEKDEKGNVTGWAMQNISFGTGVNNVDIESGEDDHEKYDAFHFQIESVVKDGDYYFTFEPYTFQQNQPVDTSLIPGGYGIYHFDYDEKTGELYPENLEMVYALDAKEHLYDITMDGKEKNLLLTTNAEDGIYLTIIDIATMTQRDRILVSTEEYLNGCWAYEDYFVFYGENLMLWEIDEKGDYTLKLSAPVQEAENFTGQLTYEQVDDDHYTRHPIELLREDCVMDWNGEQLAICNYIFHKEGSAECSFYVAIIDKAGLCYLASYRSSLVTSEGWNGCEPDWRDPFKISWNHK